jgi:SPP1 gp7 family putative phage head morphogenesis protein
MPEPIQAIIAQFQADIAAEEAAAAQRLLDAYTRIYGKLQGEVDALMAELGTAMADGQPITKAELFRSVRYQRLIADTQSEMQQYAAILEDEVARAQQAAAEKAIADSTAMVQASLEGIPEPMRGQLFATFDQMPKDAIRAMVGALQESSPLNGVLQTFGADAAKGIGDALVEGLLRGDNPLEVGALIRREFGVPLTRALTISRTEMLRAYRMATWASYRNNPSVVKGWRWFAQLDNRVCMSCVAQHGTLHTLDETLDDHPNGRCAMVPETVSMAELGLNVPETRPEIQSGQDWFKGLGEAEQRQLMGPGKFDAWKAGKFEFSQLSRESTSDKWGRMFSEASLKDLLAPVTQ